MTCIASGYFYGKGIYKYLSTLNIGAVYVNVFIPTPGYARVILKGFLVQALIQNRPL